ncbi:trichohyalin isoform X1 [Drosophila busckii]|uniref:trichohyalin isoform X1 n=1 Tax=Drosophila busckii TaxID=30019 RepID=UPI001432C075|nr:trichohyalin isoform X1 [Drosophila busckii]
MELRVWKSMLLKWVKECNFLENCAVIEDSDIDAFFEVYVQHAQVELPAQELSTQAQLRPLQIFLKEIYPDFMPHLDTNGFLLPTDHIYVYTLLLHYTCVKSPSEYFHSICKNMPDHMQRCFAAFFEQTVNRPELTRNRLCQTIASVGNNLPALEPVILVPDSTPPGRLRLRRTSPASPPGGDVLDSSYCQPTPKTQLLEQRTRELLGLRALLETERYEKTMLEEQIHENEHLINSLSRENKVKKEQLAKLKATLQHEHDDKDEENQVPNYVPNEYDNLKRRLLKELSHKDVILADSNEQLQELKAEHTKLMHKLKASEKQVRICMDSISELELRVENVSQEAASKDDEISCLQRDKLELEQCLQETRDELHKGREVLNSSGDLLDSSLSGGGLMNVTPENLASSVIDKQLRERELENLKLQEKLQQLQLEQDAKQAELEQLLAKQKEVQSFLSNLSPMLGGEAQAAQSLQQMEQALQQTFTKLNEQQQQSEAKRLQLQQLVEQLRLNITEVQQQHSSQQSKQLELLQALNAEQQHVDKDLPALLKLFVLQHQQLKQQTKELDKLHAKALGDLGQMRERLVSADVENDAKAKKLQQLHEKMQLLQAQHEDEVQQSETLLKALKAQQLQEQQKFQQELLKESEQKLKEQSNKLKAENADRVKHYETLIEELNAKQLQGQQKKQQLQQELQLLKESEQAFKEQSNKLKAENEDRVKHYETLIEELNAKQLQEQQKFQQELQVLKESEQELKEQSNKLKAENEDRVKHYETLIEELNAKQLQEKQQLQQELQVLKESEQELKEQSNKLKAENEDRVKHYETLIEELNAKQLQEKQQLQQELQVLKESEQELKEQSNKLKAENEDRVKHYETLIEELNAKQLQGQQQLQQELQVLKESEHELRELSNKLKAENEELNAKQLQGQKELQLVLKESKQKLGKQRNKLQEDNNAKVVHYEALLEDLGSAAREQQAEAKAKVDEAEAASAALQQELEANKQAAKQQAEELQSLKEQLQLAHEQQLEAQLAIEAHHQTIQQLSKELGSGQQKLKQLTAEKQTIEAKLHESELTVDKLQQDAEQRSKAMASLQQTLQQTEEQLPLIQAAVEKELQLSRQQERAAAEKQIASLQESLQRMEAAKQQQLTESEQRELEMAELARAFEDKLQQRAEITSLELKQMEEAKQQAEIATQQLQLQLDALKQQQLTEREQQAQAFEANLQKSADMAGLKLEQMAEAKDAIEAKLQQAELATEELQQQMDALKQHQLAESEQWNKELAELAQDFSEQLKQRAELASLRLEDVQTELEQAQVKLQQQEALVATLQSELEVKQQQQAELTTNAEQLQQQLVAAKQAAELQVEQLQQKSDETKQQLQQQLHEMESKQLSVQQQHKQTLERLAKRDEELERTKSLLDASTKRVEKMAIKLGELQAMLAKKQRGSSTTTSSSSSNSNSEQQAWQERLGKLEKQREANEKKQRELKQALSSVEQQKVQLQLEVGGLNSQIVQQQQKLTQLTQELQLATKQQQQQQQQQDTGLAELQSQLDEKLQQLEQQREEQLERESQYQRNLQALQEQLNESQAKLVEQQQQQQLAAATLPVADLRSRQQLELDCQILQAKYRDAKEEIGNCEQRLRDQRLEMEGKLEKLKAKMRTLYTTEVNRMKEKQERDAANTKLEMDKLMVQNSKYEEHTRKLSNQIVRLNEKILEQQKQHAMTSTKLRHLQEAAEQANAASAAAAAVSSEEWKPFKRPTAPAAGNMAANLAMEDEEGEVFNNTYLTDLKLGRVPDITAEELQYRNSLQPPHLKSAYAAQYDLNAQEDELKDGPHSLDDSMSALLSSTGAAARKKTMGTHYKRPGPPTPSKHGGRLSFGSSEPPREILRETSDNGMAKTPARFKLFGSRFSMGGGGSSSAAGCTQSLPRDERQRSQKRQQQQKLLAGLQRRKLQQRAARYFATSTPRKSRSSYDQSEQALIYASDADAAQVEDAGTPHLCQAELLALTNGQARRLSLKRTASSTSSGSSAAQHRRKRIGGGPRASLCLHGNIFAKNRRQPTQAQLRQQRSQQQRQMRQQRNGCYDRGRQLCDSETDSASSSLSGEPQPRASNVTYALGKATTTNNNYCLQNLNELPVGETLLLGTPDAPTFNVSPSPSHEQLQQQFEDEHVCSWLSGAASELSQDFHFEQLCQQTTSTAPFELQPLVLQPPTPPPPTAAASPAAPQQTSVELTRLPSKSNSNLTGNTSCTTNGSSRKSWTVYSFGHLHTQRLPLISVTPVRQQQPLATLAEQQQRSLSRLSFNELLLLGVIVLLLMLLSYLSHLFGQFTLGASTALGLFVLLSVYCYSSRKPQQQQQQQQQQAASN